MERHRENAFVTGGCHDVAFASCEVTIQIMSLDKDLYNILSIGYFCFSLVFLFNWPDRPGSLTFEIEISMNAVHLDLSHFSCTFGARFIGFVCFFFSVLFICLFISPFSNAIHFITMHSLHL